MHADCNNAGQSCSRVDTKWPATHRDAAIHSKQVRQVVVGPRSRQAPDVQVVGGRAALQSERFVHASHQRRMNCISGSA